ncbi:MAG: ribonuclease T, partial [Pseudomonadota bacterium]
SPHRLNACVLHAAVRDGYIQEARICMTRDLEFRECGADVIQDCRMQDARFEPVR